MDVVEATGGQVITRAYLALQKKAQKAQNEFKVLKVCAKPKLSELTDTAESLPTKVKLIKPEEDENEFDIRKARGEVLNFAMSNQRVAKNQKNMQIFQAIKLGAKPLPKAYKNYKELQAERKRLKDIREQRRKFNQLGKTQASLASIKYRKPKGKTEKRLPYTGIDKLYGTVQKPIKKK